MNPTSSGQPESSADSRIKGLEADWLAQDVALGIPHQPPVWLSELPTILEMSPATIKCLTGEQCGEFAVILQGFAFFLQVELNKVTSRLRWAEECIKRLVLGKSVAPSYEERRQFGLRASEQAQAIEKIRVEALLRFERIQGLVGRVDALAKSLLSLQATRRQQ